MAVTGTVRVKIEKKKENRWSFSFKTIEMKEHTREKFRENRLVRKTKCRKYDKFH